jgi:thiol peroxidase
MTMFEFKGNTFNTHGSLPEVGDEAPSFELVKTDLSVLSSTDLQGRKVVLNIFPSLDTDVCAASVRRFNAEAAKRDNVTVVCVSEDLPFAAKRFCSTEGLNDVVTGSEFRDGKFGRDYGVRIIDGPLTGLLARSVVVLDEEGRVTYTELVPEATDEPDYDAALGAVDG